VPNCVQNPGDAAASKSDAPVAREVFTVKEFCAAHRLSGALYYKLKRLGQGPRETRMGRHVTITIDDGREWRRNLPQT
jgi:hypothetical protein